MNDLEELLKLLSEFKELGDTTENNLAYQVGLYKAVAANDRHITDIKFCDLLTIVRDYTADYNQIHGVAHARGYTWANPVTQQRDR
ncbi:MAG: hypothetical protein ACXW04_01190 [Methylobacter sp.]